MPAGTKIVRVMPNTPAMVGEGMASLPNEVVTDAEKADDSVAIFPQFWQSRSRG
jgi:pyrroline-5-carboxylate reductase